MNPKVKRRYYPKLRVYGFVFFAILIIFFGTKIILWGQRVSKDTGLSPATITGLLFDSGAPLKYFEGRTNVLLMGIGGGSHQGADLTDTIMVVSVNTVGHSLGLLSIPRDIWSDTLKDKINSAYHYGEVKKAGGGIILAKVVIEDVVGIPIHYGLVVDFSGFEDIIDRIGGIQMSVPEAFTDTQFPIEGKENDDCSGDPQFACRYKTVQFDAGLQRMTGEQALTYVRSRHAQGDEGSDFARGRRQQDMLLALKDQLTNPWIWLSLDRSRALFSAFDRATDTDMNIGELLTAGKLISRISQERTKKISIEQFLASPPLWMYGRYVLTPQNDYNEIHEYIQTELQ